MDEDTILKTLREFREDVCGHLHEIDADNKLIRGEVQSMRSEINALQRKYDGLTDSDRKLSDHDMQHDSTIASVVEHVKKLETAVLTRNKEDSKILERLDKVTENPVVKKWGERAFVAVVMTVLTWLAGHGGKAPPVLDEAQAAPAQDGGHK